MFEEPDIEVYWCVKCDTDLRLASANITFHTPINLYILGSSNTNNCIIFATNIVTTWSLSVYIDVELMLYSNGDSLKYHRSRAHCMYPQFRYRFCEKDSIFEVWKFKLKCLISDSVYPESYQKSLGGKSMNIFLTLSETASPILF